MKRIILLSMAMLAFVSMTSCVYDDPQTDYAIAIGETIPDFTVTMNDGSTVTGASLRKGPAVIVFFHTMCPDCQNTIPSVQKIYDEYLEKGVSFALISRSQVEAEIEPYWQENGYTMPYSGQPDRAVYNLFATSRVPRVYICKDGKIMKIYTDDPIPTYEELHSDVESLL